MLLWLLALLALWAAFFITPMLGLPSFAVSLIGLGIVLAAAGYLFACIHADQSFKRRHDLPRF
jgi:Na+/H+ antiporter NhaD/arsenite permease-like protein